MAQMLLEVEMVGSPAGGSPPNPPTQSTIFVLLC
jgi:hypothetical protein